MADDTPTKPYNYWFREKTNSGLYSGPRVGHWILTCLAALVGCWFLWVVLFAWPFAQTPRDKMGLSYGGGPFEGAHYQKTIPPGHGLFVNGLKDHLYKYPAVQRNYIVSMHPDEGDRAEADAIQVVTRDNVRMDFETATTTMFNTDEARQFHERIGLKFKAWTDSGWKTMLDQTVRQVQENALVQAAKKYTAKELRSDAIALSELQHDVSVAMNRGIIDLLGGNYFCNPDWQPGEHCGDMKFIVKKPTIVDAKIVRSYEDNAASEIDVQTAANKVKQAEQQRQEIDKLNEALSRSGGQYPLLKAIEKGKVQFWVLPSDSKLTLPTPQVAP